jgi:ribosomal protein L31
MKSISTLAFALVALFAAWPADAAAQSYRRDERVCFYGGPNFRGWEQCYGPNNNRIELGNRGSNVGSIRINGRAIVDVYDSSGYSRLQFDSDVPDLRRIISSTRSWNGRVDSVRLRWIADDPRGDNRYGRGRGVQIRDGICVYEHAGYTGRSECFAAGDRIVDVMRRYGRNDEISSIRVFGRAVAVLYRDAGFAGEQLIIERDVPDLARINMALFRSWNDQISSMKVESWSARR